MRPLRLATILLGVSGLVLFGSLTFPAFQAATPSVSAQTTKHADTLRLEDGTPIKLRLQRTISSADAQVDEKVDFDVLDEIKIKDIVVIPKGSVAWGTVTEAQ